MEASKETTKTIVPVVEETLNGLLDAEADALCQASKYERTAERVNTRTVHYEETVAWGIASNILIYF